MSDVFTRVLPHYNPSVWVAFQLLLLNDSVYFSAIFLWTGEAVRNEAEVRMDILVRIKRLVIAGQVIFTEKAENEMSADGLIPELVYEAILNAPAVTKSLRSRNPVSGKREMLYVIKGLTFDGLAVYTKGKILKYAEQEVFYVLISSKRSTD